MNFVKEVIAIINQKGGVGKSTTALALGVGLKRRGYRILFIDLDAQGNLTHTLGIQSANVTSIDLLAKRLDVREVLQKVEKGSVVPASPILAGADTVLTEVGKEYRLKEALSKILDDYDYVIIDTPPALGVLTINALTACSSIVIPAQADIYSLQGIHQLHQTIDTVKKYCNPSVKVKGILLTRYNVRSILSRDLTEIIEQTAQKLDTKLFTSTIREGIAIKESQVNQQDIYTYAPKSNVALDYESFIEEFLGRS